MICLRWAQTSLVLLCALSIGCTNRTYRRPEYNPDEPQVRYDPSEMSFFISVPYAYVAESGTKVRMLISGPSGNIVTDEPRWGEYITDNGIHWANTIFPGELEKLSRKGGEGTYSVFLFVQRPGESTWQVASDQFTLPP